MSRLLAPLLLALLLPLPGCAEEETLTVLAAASLTDAFEELAVAFEEEHGTEVRLSFGSSTDLAHQAADGAPGDVLATADETSMAVAVAAGVTGEVSAFASNELVIVTPPGNPADVGSPADLPGSTWVRCADEVPCGRVALEVLADHGVRARPTSLEEDVRAALDKVVAGEVEAGLVYATDAVAAGPDVATVPIPGAATRSTSYLLAVLDQAEDPGLARAWVDLVRSEEGRRVLADAGFAAP